MSARPALAASGLLLVLTAGAFLRPDGGSPAAPLMTGSTVPGFPAVLAAGPEPAPVRAPRPGDMTKAEAEAGGRPRPRGQRATGRDPVGRSGRVPVNALMKAKWQRDLMPRYGGDAGTIAAGIGPGDWTELGPNNIGGRLRGLLIDPSSPNVMYAGAASGGVFKSVDGAVSWFPLDDFLDSLAIGCMAMDPSDPSRIYVGTGEVSGGGGTGAGIFVTQNGGASFTQMASTVGWDYVNAIAVDAGNANHILAATDSAIFVTGNGGASWTETYTGDTRDVRFRPGSGAVLAAGTQGGQVLSSSDGGFNWAVELDESAAGATKMTVRFAPSNPAVLYVAAASTDDIWRGSLGGPFTRVHDGTDLSLSSYHTSLWVDPVDANTIIAGGVDLFRGTYSAGSMTLQQISKWSNWPLSAHADQHLIVDHPDYDGVSNRTVFFGTDGGVFLTYDVSNVGSDADYIQGWQVANNGLAITQFYAGASDSTGQLVWGGTQDNGTLMFDGQGGIWHTINGGDGFRCAGDPRDRNVMYFEGQNGGLRRSLDAGASSIKIEDFDGTDNAPFDTRYALDQNAPDRMYVAPRSVWRCDDVLAADPVFTKIFDTGTAAKSIAVATGNSDELWVGYNGGQLRMSANATTGSPSFTDVAAGSVLPSRSLTALAISATTGDVYIGFSEYAADNLWVTRDKGATFTQLGVGTLLALPINDIVLHPTVPGRMYIATDLGIYVSEDDGATWMAGNEGPANVIVDDLWWAGGKLYAATHGRGIWVARVDDTLVVPDDFTTIQEAIDASSSMASSVIEVRPGYYNENLRLNGREITLQSTDGALATFIDGTASNVATVRFVDGETNSTVLSGFTVVGGDHLCMTANGSSPIVRDCRLVGGHSVGQSGGLRIVNGAAPIVERCEFLVNSASLDGGAVRIEDSTGWFAQCAFAGNSASGSGGAIHIDNGTLDVVCCSFSDNCSATGGQSIHAVSSDVSVVNSILWNAKGDEVVESGSTVQIDSSDVYGGWTGAGGNNIEADPLYADPADFELRLLPGSPCLDAGDLELLNADQDYDLRGAIRVADGDRQGGEQVNMGAHESIPLDVSDFGSIQAAIDQAEPVAGVVAVPPGTYDETLRTWGKRILLIGTEGAAATIVDANGAGTALRCGEAGRLDTVVDGLTLQDGLAQLGGGVYAAGDVTLRDCVVRGSHATQACGGVYLGGTRPRMERCIVRGNTSAGNVGGVGAASIAAARLSHCLVTDNDSANSDGDGVSVGIGRALELIQTTVTANAGDGVRNRGVLFASGCIVHGNVVDLGDNTGLAEVRYSDVGGVIPGVDGNIDADPLFMNAGGGDFRLRVGSPCIDAADNVDVPFLDRYDLGGQRRFRDLGWIPDTGNPDGIREQTDMGAYEAKALESAKDGL